MRTPTDQKYSENNVLLLQTLPHDTPGLLIDAFYHEYGESLKQSQISMLSSFNLECKTDVSGVFLVLDLGGSTLKIATVELNAKNSKILFQKSWEVANDQKVMNEQFFDMIALNLNDFVSAFKTIDNTSYLQLLNGNCIKTGVSWSFPLNQSSPNNGTINSLGKGYRSTDYTENQNISSLIELSCQKLNLSIKIICICNDSISVLVSAKYFNQNTQLGLVLGTGINCSFVIPSEKLPPFKIILGELNEKFSIINSELCFFGGSQLSFHALIFDKLITDNWLSGNKKPHLNNETENLYTPLELMTSGRYVCELVRLSLIYEIENKNLFDGNLPPNLVDQKFHLSGDLVVSIFHKNDFSDFNKIYPFENQYRIADRDRKVARQCIKAIVNRAVVVCGSALVALLIFINDIANDRHFSCISKNTNQISIGFVGSFLKYFDYYKSNLQKFINQNYRMASVSLTYIKDSNLYGPAIAAAANSKDAEAW
ncbi:hexokinase [Ascoidea rubescens DSM 1968]|uniref:Phosphotransferase n=1 Tax=Ascoidea rubescens DSM 1968 TaxID=1344418 RepID=A0A1D2VHF2_9ASCO|nr:actin-like ATPase domain-containing protein [Ascoidea rubescens DSM 1968]ODV61022.1 actin-like ATPase domain-containing protein [Ascoidea rubescens DSM 1968]